MSGETSITIIGNLTADPELRYTQAGIAVANLTVASTPRVFDRTTNEMKDGETLFMRSSVWREQAEYVAGSLQKGQRVIVTGELKQRSFTDKDSGANRSVIELDIDEIGPSLRFGSAVYTRGEARAAQAPAAPVAEAPVAQAAPAVQAAAAPSVAPATEIQF